MAFDGITISNIIHELNNTITGGRIYKISQPETDEILLTVKTSLGQYRLVLSAKVSKFIEMFNFYIYNSLKFRLCNCNYSSVTQVFS